MKKILLLFIILSTMIMFCSCSDKKKSPQIYTETLGDCQITYTYDDDRDSIISKNIYDTKTGYTIEYCYFYECDGYGEHLVGVSVITITKDGQIIDGFDSHK